MYYNLDILCTTVNHGRAFRNVSWEFNLMSPFQKLVVTGGDMKKTKNNKTKIKTWIKKVRV